MRQQKHTISRSIKVRIMSEVDYWLDAWNAEIAKQEEQTDVAKSEWKAAGRATKANPNKEDDKWWLENGRKMFQNWVAWRAGGWSMFEINGIPAVEVNVNPIWNNIPVQMHIDRVMVTPEGELVVLDIKTGARTPTSDMQLAFYAAGMEEMLGIRPKWGAYWMAREGIVSEMIDLDNFPKEYVIDIVTKFDAARKAGIFIPNFGHCMMCNIKDKCKYKTKEGK